MGGGGKRSALRGVTFQCIMGPYRTEKALRNGWGGGGGGGAKKGRAVTIVDPSVEAKELSHLQMIYKQLKVEPVQI